MTCDAFREDMLDVLYGEADPEAVRRAASHQEACAPCREEMHGLRDLRGELKAWSVAPTARRSPGAAPARVQWLFLAATLILSVGASVLLSRGRLDREDGRWALRFDATESRLSAQLAAQEIRHREEIRALRASFTPPSTVDGTALMQRVEGLLRASETRQGVVLEARLAELSTRSETQRRYDLAQMQAGLTYLDGKTGMQAARTTELVGQFLQASHKR